MSSDNIHGKNESLSSLCEEFSSSVSLKVKKGSKIHVEKEGVRLTAKRDITGKKFYVVVSTRRAKFRIVFNLLDDVIANLNGNPNERGFKKKLTEYLRKYDDPSVDDIQRLQTSMTKMKEEIKKNGAKIENLKNEYENFKAQSPSPQSVMEEIFDKKVVPLKKKKFEQLPPKAEKIDRPNSIKPKKKTFQEKLVKFFGVCTCPNPRALFLSIKKKKKEKVLEIEKPPKKKDVPTPKTKNEEDKMEEDKKEEVNNLFNTI